MKPHYSEADLLETYYMRPGESMPVMMHLAGCSECAARYERLEVKMHSLRACAHEEKPETFWARQRIAVMRKIDGRRKRWPLAGLAAAAVLVLVLGGVITRDGNESPSSVQVVDTTTAPAALSLDESTPRRLDDSPWASDELEDYSAMVAWESWVENGDQS